MGKLPFTGARRDNEFELARWFTSSQKKMKMIINTHIVPCQEESGHFELTSSARTNKGKCIHSSSEQTQSLWNTNQNNTHKWFSKQKSCDMKLNLVWIAMKSSLQQLQAITATAGAVTLSNSNYIIDTHKYIYTMDEWMIYITQQIITVRKEGRLSSQHKLNHKKDQNK